MINISIDESTLPMLSATQLKTFKECKRLYYFNYRDRNRGLTNPATIMGSALHYAIEQHLRTGLNPIVLFSQDYERRIEEAAEGRQVKNYDKANAIKRTGFEIIGNIQWNKLNPRSLDDIEKKFTLPFPNEKAPIAYITGIIDLITIDGFIIDHKSSSRLPTAHALEHDPQFIIYYWAYKQLENKVPVGVLWHHLRTGEFHNTNVDRDYPARLKWLTLAIKELIAEKNYEKKPAPDSFCEKVCDFRTICWGNEQ